MSKRRIELAFQKHILDSYVNCSGYGRKWATEWQVGMPDLIVSLPLIGCHLAEVKHRPEWQVGNNYANPLDKKQVQIARKYLEGGALVIGLVVVECTKAIGSKLCLFGPLADRVYVTPHNTVAYEPAKKYDVMQLVAEHTKGLT